MSSKLKSLAKIGLLSLVVVFLGAGCNPFANSPEENLAEMRKKMTDINSVEYQADISVKDVKKSNSQDSKQGEVNQFLSGPLSKADKFNIKLSGKSSLENYFEPKSKLNISASVPSSDQDIKLNLRQVNNVNYLNVSSLGPLQSSPMAAMLGSKLIGNWIKLPKSQNKDNDKKLTQKEISDIKDVIRNTNFFTVVKDLGEENVNGRSAYHYLIKANKSEIKNFNKRIKEITNSKDEKNNQWMTKNLEQLKDKEFDIWITTKEKYLYKLSIKDLAAEGKNRNSTIDLTLNLSNYNSEVNVGQPENVKSIGELMGGMFGAGSESGSSNSGSSGLLPSGESGSSNKGKIEFNLNNNGASTKGNMKIKNKVLNQKQ